MALYRVAYACRSLRRGLLCLLFLLLIGATEGASSKAVPTHFTVKGVPYVAQLPNYCGPAALSGVLSFWGKPVPQSAIAEQAYDKRRNATHGAELLLYAREQGFGAYTYFSSMAALKAHLRAGLPVIILQDMSASDRRGHFRTVIGYNDRSRTLFVRDSNFEEVRRYSYEEFDRLWTSFGRWALVVCPKDREAELDRSVKDNAVLHLDLCQAYLRRKQHDLAREELMATLQIEPENEEAQELLARL